MYQQIENKNTNTSTFSHSKSHKHHSLVSRHTFKFSKYLIILLTFNQNLQLPFPLHKHSQNLWGALNNQISHSLPANTEIRRKRSSKFDKCTFSSLSSYFSYFCVWFWSVIKLFSKTVFCKHIKQGWPGIKLQTHWL